MHLKVTYPRSEVRREVCGMVLLGYPNLVRREFRKVFDGSNGPVYYESRLYQLGCSKRVGFGGRRKICGGRKVGINIDQGLVVDLACSNVT